MLAEAYWTKEYATSAADKGMDIPECLVSSIMDDGEGSIHGSLK
jgi:hypothetical protein